MAKDILLKDDDLWIRNGDFVVDESDLQNIYLIVRLHKGNTKQFPRIGFGDERLLNGTVDGKTRREIQLQLESDGYRLKRLIANPETIRIEI